MKNVDFKHLFIHMTTFKIGRISPIFIYIYIFIESHCLSDSMSAEHHKNQIGGFVMQLTINPIWAESEPTWNPK